MRQQLNTCDRFGRHNQRRCEPVLCRFDRWHNRLSLKFQRSTHCFLGVRGWSDISYLTSFSDFQRKSMSKDWVRWWLLHLWNKTSWLANGRHTYTTFTNFYLKDLTIFRNKMLQLPPTCADQRVMKGVIHHIIHTKLGTSISRFTFILLHP